MRALSPELPQHSEEPADSTEEPDYLKEEREAIVRHFLHRAREIALEMNAQAEEEEIAKLQNSAPEVLDLVDSDFQDFVLVNHKKSDLGAGSNPVERKQIFLQNQQGGALSAAIALGEAAKHRTNRRFSTIVKHGIDSPATPEAVHNADYSSWKSKVLGAMPTVLVVHQQAAAVHSSQGEEELLQQSPPPVPVQGVLERIVLALEQSAAAIERLKELVDEKDSDATAEAVSDEIKKIVRMLANLKENFGPLIKVLEMMPPPINAVVYIVVTAYNIINHVIKPFADDPKLVGREVRALMYLFSLTLSVTHWCLETTARKLEEWCLDHKAEVDEIDKIDKELLTTKQAETEAEAEGAADSSTVKKCEEEVTASSESPAAVEEDGMAQLSTHEQDDEDSAGNEQVDEKEMAQQLSTHEEQEQPQSCAAVTAPSDSSSANDQEEEEEPVNLQ